MKKVECIIMDWAGTSVDYGCMAPVRCFCRKFQKHWFGGHPGRNAGIYGVDENRRNSSFICDRTSGRGFCA